MWGEHPRDGLHEAGRREVRGRGVAREGVAHHDVEGPGLERGQPLEPVGLPQPEPAAPAVPEPLAHEVDDGGVRLEHHLPRARAGGGDVAGERAPGAADVQGVQRLAGLGQQVEHPAGPPHVLELQPRGVAEVHVGCSAPRPRPR
ncbi:hypothetical protein GCM10025868_44300 [Angustibacter aerolatus]|uniref:Uncharacterized protein n=1 Tax=Angustibacter aerolatus TaxID=1162965 RepID=A0ABQ6JPJ3_9ACTN|nr:hypothetical protein GCM10025868_44300 [Angustibacter aerolatus]